MIMDIGITHILLYVPTLSILVIVLFVLFFILSLIEKNFIFNIASIGICLLILNDCISNNHTDLDLFVIAVPLLLSIKNLIDKEKAGVIK